MILSGHDLDGRYPDAGADHWLEVLDSFVLRPVGIAAFRVYRRAFYAYHAIWWLRR
jgi:hypothetical protein